MRYSALDDSGSIHGDHQFLIGGDDQDPDLGVGGGDVDLLAADLVLLLVQLHAHEGQLLGDVHAVLRAVLTHAGGEDDGVHSAHGGGVGADELGDAVLEGIQRQLSPLIALGGGIFQVTEDPAYLCLLRADIGILSLLLNAD